MRYGSGGRLDELGLAEDQDPKSFPSERSRRNSIRFDRFAGRHPVLVTVLFGAFMGGMAYLAATGSHVTGERLVLRVITYSFVVVAVTTQVGWLAFKAHKRYHGR